MAVLFQKKPVILSLPSAAAAIFLSQAHTRPSFYLELCQECLECEKKNIKIFNDRAELDLDYE